MLAFLVALCMPLQTPPVYVTKITITPQCVPAPSFRYVLLPPLADQTTGNAVQSYYRCLAPDCLSGYLRNKFDGKILRWLELPYEEAAKKGQTRTPRKPEEGEEEEITATTREEASALLNSRIFDEIDVAARRTYAEWEYLEKIKQSGYALLLPEVQGIRLLANIVTVRARLQLMEGNYDASLRHLQTGMALARHLDDTHIIIGALVGNAVTRSMSDVMLEWVQQPGSPNLFWALADLPQPYFDIRKAFSGDRVAMQNLFGDYRRLNERVFSVEEMRQVVDEKVKPALRLTGNSSDLSILVMKEYSQAKTWLKEQGRTPEEVERMPATQAVLLYVHWQLQMQVDEYQQLFALPPLDRLRQVEKSEKSLNTEPTLLSTMVRMAYLPSFPNIWLNMAATERQLALLRCIEAIRHYAAVHEQKLPATWEEISGLPIPVDPATGERFGYQLKGDHAVITLKAIKTDHEWRRERVYEVYVK